MFAYLAKKIAIPNAVKIRSLSYNEEQGGGGGWLACGGDDGMLKVLKLETARDGSGARGIAAPTNLSMNQTLEGHRGCVVVTTWNPAFRKLTTSDQNGLIIVWLMHKGSWFEEMINNRNKSVVRDMRWRSNGQEICIAYEDGMVIVGNVDGNRIWSRDMGASLLQVEWSPAGRLLLFVTADSQVVVHNHQGVRLGAVRLQATLDSGAAGAATATAAASPKIVALEWYDGTKGHAITDTPTLAIGFENGRVQLMRDEADASPVLIDTGLVLAQARWNCNGTVLALAGSPAATAGGATTAGPTAEVQFYASTGRYITTLRVPGGAISAISWEGGGLRLALAVESYVYFANVRPSYRWAAFGDTVAYAFSKPDRPEQCVVFWDTKTDERHVKHVRRLLAMQASGENCVLVSVSDEQAAGVMGPDDGAAGGAPAAPAPALAPAGGSGGAGGPSAPKQYVLILCNAIGSPVDSKYISVSPDFVAMTPFHIAVASSDTLYVWHYRTQVSRLTSADSNLLRRKEGRERIFHVEGGAESGDAAAPSGAGGNLGSGSGVGGGGAPICALAASLRFLLVARENGAVHQYSLPSLTLDNRFQLRCRPVSMRINSDSTRFSVVDASNVLTFFDMEARAVGPSGATTIGEHLPFERKDVWDMMWADDYPDLWSMTEKHRMYVFRGTEPEEPVLSSGYLRRFTDLTISSVLLDEVFERPDVAAMAATHTCEHEIRSLRDMRTLLGANSLRDCLAFVERNAHPRLWRLLAETALGKLDLSLAERAFVAAGDYPGIQFVKRLQLLQDKSKQRAEVAAFFLRFAEAEDIYLQMDRKDLALELRMRIGDWQHVLAQLSAGGAAQGEGDELLEQAYAKVGDFWADRQQWDLAIRFHERSKALDTLVECYYMVERFDRIVALIDALPAGSALLTNIARKLQSVGITEDAARAYLKAGDIKASVDCAVTAHHWDTAVELAHEHQLPQVEGLLTRYAAHLMEQGKTMAAVELYRKAHRDSDSAQLLAQLGHETVRAKLHPLRAKQFFVLAALEVERHRKRTLDLSAAAGGGSATAAATAATLGGFGGGGRGSSTMATAAATLDTLMRNDAEAGRTLGGETLAGDGFGGGGGGGGGARTFDSAWHGAKACHWLLLTQRLLYAGQVEDAMVVAQRLPLYEDVLDPRDIYSLIAVTSYYNKHLALASRALICLEHLESLSAEQQERFADVAFAIFQHGAPTDPFASLAKAAGPGCSQRGCPGRPSQIEARCAQCGTANDLCVASGRLLAGGGAVISCTTCRNASLASEAAGRRSCALCHAATAPS